MNDQLNCWSRSLDYRQNPKHGRASADLAESEIILIIELEIAYQSLVFLAGRLQKMSNFNVLARLAPLGSLPAPARQSTLSKVEVPRLRNCRLERDFAM